VKRGSLSPDEVRHLEHRLAVIRSFLDVSSDGRYSHAADHTAEWRIFRGCMDGAIATSRALCERFGLTVYSKDWTATLEPCSPEFRQATKALSPNATDSECDALWEVLVAANRCVCHLEDKLIDHNVKPDTLRDAVRLLQSVVRTKLIEAGLPSAHESHNA
jgi:hypothetical protein